jgi:phage I-like protein
MKTRHSLTIELDASKAPPSEFRIFPQGMIETTKGIFRFDAEAARSVMAAVTDWGNDYCLDYDHSMMSFFSMDPSESVKAAGWFKPELRNGELWASQVSWTPKAASMLSQREVRYTSPTFCADEDGTISELVNVALTNLPATKKQTPLMASKKADEPKKENKAMKKLSLIVLGALGLSADSDDTTVISAINQLKERARNAGDAGKDLADAHKRLNELTGKASFSESLGVVLSWKESAPQIEKLTARISELEQTGRAGEVERMVEAGIKDGKIAPAQKDYWLTNGKKDPEMLKGFLSTAGTVVPTKGATEPDKKGSVALTDDQKKDGAKLGLDEKQMIAVAEKMAGRAA